MDDGRAAADCTSGASIVQRAQRIVGTSAGSAVAAQITSGMALPNSSSGRSIRARQTRRDRTRTAATAGPLRAALLPLMKIEHRSWNESGALPNLRSNRRRWRSPPAAPSSKAVCPIIAGPSARSRTVAVDAESGETRIFDRHSGVGIVDAVAASCAVPGLWPCVTIDGHRYMDGGDSLAPTTRISHPSARVLLVVSPIGTRRRTPILPANWPHSRTMACSCELIEPDSSIERGARPLIPSTCKGERLAAHAGRRPRSCLTADKIAAISGCSGAPAAPARS